MESEKNIVNTNNNRVIYSDEFDSTIRAINNRIELLEHSILPQIDAYVSSFLCHNPIPTYLENTYLEKVDIIIVEGKTDKEYLLRAISVLNEELHNMIKNNKLKIFADPNNGGVNNVEKYLYNRIYNHIEFKTMILLDNDKEGRKTINKIKENESIRNNKLIKLLTIKPPKELKDIQRTVKHLPFFSIEHLLSVSFWKKLKQKGLIEKENIEYIFELLDKEQHFDTFNSSKFINDIKLDPTVKECYFGYKAKSDKKNMILEMAKKSTDNNLYSGFKDTVDEIKIFFIEKNKK